MCIRDRRGSVRRSHDGNQFCPGNYYHAGERPDQRRTAGDRIQLWGGGIRKSKESHPFYGYELYRICLLYTSTFPFAFREERQRQ